ncbi:MAG: lamin tail domain-containing protein [Deltaproteobacteria bacterium]|nr:lamin tail domain-containing protein [Deltaproteobacteria bacterium]
MKRERHPVSAPSFPLQVAAFVLSAAVMATSTLTISVAEAQVVISEVQPNPPGTDESEWIELENIGSTDASIEGFVIQDFGPASPRRYAFPTGSALAPHQVIILARAASSYATLAQGEGFSRTIPDYELAEGDDDPGTPNLIVVEGSSALQLGNSGDGVALYDAAGVFVSGVEWSIDRAEIPGAPLSDAAGSGESLGRIGLSGNSADDFEIFVRPTPGEGMGTTTNAAPLLSDPRTVPNVLIYGQASAFEVSATDADGVHNVVGYFALASTPAAPTSTDFIGAAMTPDVSTPTRHALTGTPESIFPGLASDPPTGFHDRYLRYYFESTDTLGATGTLPANASPAAGSTAFFWENILPANLVVTVAAARQQDAATHTLTYDNHAVRVDAMVISASDAFSTTRTDFFVRDLQGPEAIHVFSRAPLATSLLPGDRVRLTGRLSSFAGLRQIGDDARSDVPTLVVESLGTSAPPEPEPQFMTIAELLFAPEDLESRLIGLHNVQVVGGPGQDPADAPAFWPTGGTTYVVDATGLIAVRVSATSPLAGAPTPVGPFDLMGILGQYVYGTGTPDPATYQILPRGLDDIAINPSTSDGGVTTDAGPIDAEPIDAEPADAGTSDAEGTDAIAGDADRDGGVSDANREDTGPEPGDANDAADADDTADAEDAADADDTSDASDAGDAGDNADAGTAADALPNLPDAIDYPLDAAGQGHADAETSGAQDGGVGARDALSWGAQPAPSDDEGGCSCTTHLFAGQPAASTNSLDLLFLTMVGSAIVLRRRNRRREKIFPSA